MQHLRVYIIFGMILVISARRYDSTPRTTMMHKINKREDVVNKHHRDPGKTFASMGKLHPIPETMANTTRLLDVKSHDVRSRSMKNHTQQRNYHGYMQLAPPNQFTHRNYNTRSQRLYPRDGRNRMRYYNSRPRGQRSKKPSDLVSGLSRWFFSDEADESREVVSSKIYPRQSSYRPAKYHYPPFWHPGPSSSASNHKFNSFPRFQKSRAVHHRPFTNNKINFVKNDCNSCNSVPWTPILKPSAVHQSFADSQSYSVPTIEVHHDVSGYDTTHKQNVVPAPAPVIEHSLDSTIPASYGLPVGNIPTAHGLLPPINHLKIAPTGLIPPPPTVLHPVPTDGLLQSIPFPELSPIPVVPIHDSNQFLQVDTPDLVPPIPPQKSISNVVFTISENVPENANPVVDNNISQTEQVHGTDQHPDSSSFVNTHFANIPGPFNPYNHANNHVDLDIVKSVPVAEYTSSIEYPLQIIQSPQYIDITTVPNITKAETPTYEKVPQTGNQKISDILFGLVKDTESKQSLNDAQSSGTKLVEQSAIHSNIQNPNHYHNTHNLPTQIPPVADGLKDKFIGSGPVFSQNQQYAGNLIYSQPQSPVWLDQSGTNAQPYVNAQPHKAKLESGNDGLLPDPTSTTWLIPAQSNLEPQWILPVSNPPSVPYPLLPEEGIATAVNEELSPTPLPAPMNDFKTKKIQIIIPYTSGDNKKDLDQSILESSNSEVYKTSVEQAIPQEPNHGDSSNHHGRKVPGQQIASFSVPSNATQNTKFINDVHHILALNIKELLKDEVEKPKAEQNIRLQKNIDNWTALEYSNHKTVVKKEPQEVISFANAVTSIPGTSISHLLLTSKKIPDKYLTTTPLPLFDEPATTPFGVTSSVSVESKPFTTKTYDTAGLYSTVTRIAPTTTTLKTIIKDMLKENKNHRNGYTEVVKTKANQWGKLKENLVLPENVNKSTTPVWSDKKISFDEKVYVVTPVSVWHSSSADVNKRTTRQVFMTERPETGNATASPEEKKSYISKLFGNKTERAKISKFNKPKPIQKFFATTKVPPRNITKIQIKDIPLTKVEIENEIQAINKTEKKSINDVFPFRNGGELPLELAIANSTEKESLVQDSGVKKALVKEVKNSKDFRKVKAENSTKEVRTVVPSATKSLETLTIHSPKENSTAVNLEEGEFGLKVRNEDKNVSKKALGGSSIKNKTITNTSNLPPGIFGETKRVELAKDDDESSSGLITINKTIELLKEYLQESSDELPREKTENTGNFKDKYLP